MLLVFQGPSRKALLAFLQPTRGEAKADQLQAVFPRFPNTKLKSSVPPLVPVQAHWCCLKRTATSLQPLLLSRAERDRAQASDTLRAQWVILDKVFFMICC